jgi:hypothetical protein
VGLAHILANRVLTSHLSSLTSCIGFCSIEHQFPSRSEPTVLKMAEDQWAMYNGLSDKGAHSIKWFKIAKNFLKLAFAGDRCQVSVQLVQKQKDVV